MENNRESEFIYFRANTDRHMGRLALVWRNIDSLLNITINIPKEIRNNPYRFHRDSSSFEDELNQEIEDFLELDGPVPLFDERTLLLLFGKSTTNRHEMTAKNIQHHMAEILALSVGHTTPEHPRTRGRISFNGFRGEEVESFMNAYKRRAEGLLRKIRDIHTHTKYLYRSRAAIHLALGSIEDAPEELRRARKTTSEDRVRKDVPVFDEFWLSRAVGMSTAMKVLDCMSAITHATRPDENQPNTLDFFSSDETNKLSIPRLSY